jgi:hypothetical protein
MRRMLLVISLSAGLVAGGVAAGTASAKHHHKKHHHKKSNIKVTMKGWYLITNHGNETVLPGASVVVCKSTDQYVGFMGMAYSWTKAKLPTHLNWTFTGPGLNYPESYGLTAKSGSYPGNPYGVTSNAQTRPSGTVGFLPGSYTGKISLKGKTLATETLTLANC